LLSLLRSNAGQQQGNEPSADTPVAAPMPLAYLVAGDETIDAEIAALSLARQLADRQAEPVALLMLDPLGATLRVTQPGDSPTPRRVAPQRRVSGRADWPHLLDRIEGRVGRLLLLDTTGRQFFLHDAPEIGLTAVILSSPGEQARVQAYRHIKELHHAGVGQVGLFVVQPRGVNGDDSTQPLEDLARAHTQRLADTAERFLDRRLVYFGCTSGREPVERQAELLGQRPRIEGDENRAGLTRWLNERTTPLLWEGPSPGSADPLPDDDSPTAENPPRDTRHAAVIPLYEWPQEQDELTELIASHIESEGEGNVELLAFRPPFDEHLLLAVEGSDLLLVRASGVESADQVDALASLVEGIGWVAQHWPLLRAYAGDRLSEAASPRLILAAERIAAPIFIFASLLPCPIELLELTRVDLSRVGEGDPPIAAMISVRETD
jgi:hypothetical protein